MSGSKPWWRLSACGMLSSFSCATLDRTGEPLRRKWPRPVIPRERSDEESAFAAKEKQIPRYARNDRADFISMGGLKAHVTLGRETDHHYPARLLNRQIGG